jgi:hypothetical protein
MMRGLVVAAALVVVAGAFACDSFEATDQGGPTPAGDASAQGTDASDTPDSPANDGAKVDAAPCDECPKLIATSSRPITWVVLDETRVLWTDAAVGGGTGDLRACPKTGCSAQGPAVLFADRPVGALGTDGTTAFASVAFGVDVGVFRLNGNGTRTLEASYGNIYWLNVRDSLRYMNEYGGSLARKVYVKAAGQATGLLLCTLADPAVNTDWSVVSLDRVFLGAHNTGAIYSCPRTGGEFTTYLANGDQSWVSSMAADNGSIYWVDLLDRLNTCSANPATCPQPTTLLEGGNPRYSGAPAVVAQGGGDLFVLTLGGDLVGCKAVDCPNTATVLAHEPAFALDARVASSNLAVDATDIYYVARDGAPDAGATYRLMRLPRKPL